MTDSPAGPGVISVGPATTTFDQRAFLLHAKREAETKGYADELIIDCDFHQIESKVWGEILEYVDNSVVQRYLHAGRSQSRDMAAGMWYPASFTNEGMQSVSGRIRATDSTFRSTQSGSEGELALIQESLEMLGLDYVVLFPTNMLSFGINPNVELEPHIARAHARWITDRITSKDPRVLTLLYLPFNDPSASLRLVEDFANHPGVVGFMVTSVRYKPMHDNVYAELYSALQERGLPLGIHSGFNHRERSMEQFNKFLSVHALGFPYYNMVQATNWIVNGMPERYPGLNLIFIESGLAWIPFLMHRLDHSYLMRTSEAPLLTKLPSEYLRGFYYTSQPFERVNLEYLRTTLELINAETQLLYSSDWPHWDFDLPSMVWDLPFISEEGRRRILGRNAAELFGLPIKTKRTEGVALAR